MADVPIDRSRAHTYSTADDLWLSRPAIRWPSWGAILAGTVVATGTQILFAVLGIALGLTVARADSATADAAPRLATAGAIWWLVTGTIAMILGGIIVGRFAGFKRWCDVSLHALTVWAATAALGALVVGGSAGAATGTAAMSLSENTPAWSMQRMATGEMAGREGAQDAGAAGAARSDVGQRDLSPAERADMETARRFVRNASWLTFGGLLLGIIATIGSAMVTAKYTPMLAPGTTSTTLNPSI
jgi:hypothetical protein